ncbi:helix-turn-helix transcriptional regulator [Streptomyces sp. So13.3]|uniref:helix-turn-helix domain-containing protein n=1 Tax=Streptomyces TaxID=1883 RepID=UPI001106DFA6|nr:MULTISPECIES: helix-turn-helix transcriptional regulator [Streptomyces]QNA72331.1 helix-turn-helix transcriptional regulator [Streptomyces sp. So13.3]
MNRDPEAWKRLGRLLRDARDRRGLTQAKFAEEAGVSTKAVYSAEAGATPMKQLPRTVVKIAAAHGWTPESIHVVLDGGDPALVHRAGQPEEPPLRPAPGEAAHPRGPGLIELMPRVYEFGRLCSALGGDPALRDAFETALQRLVESIPREVVATQDSHRLAAYRPHAEGEGPASDDEERILRAMERTPE